MAVISRAEAKALGLKRYFTGKPCKWGHVAERLTSNRGCCKCVEDRSREYQRQWRTPQKNHKYRQKQLTKNPDNFRKCAQRRSRQWRADNPDKCREQKRRIRANPLHRIIKSQGSLISRSLKGNKSHRTMKYVGCTPQFLRNHLMKLAVGTDFTLENYGKIWHVDHLYPISMFDLSCERDLFIVFNWSNLRPLDAIENIKKRNRPPTSDEVREHFNKISEHSTSWQSIVVNRIV